MLTEGSHTCGSLDLYSFLYSLLIGDTYGRHLNYSAWDINCVIENLLDIVVPSYRYVFYFLCICLIFHLEIFL